jgi:WhiB family redox-sensing transcriptional regulator
LKIRRARESIHKRGNTVTDDRRDPDRAKYEEQSTMDWRHRAICRDEDPELFFPVGTSGPALLQIAEAKTVCRRCPVVTECLTWALESGQDAGVWGGMSEDERRALKRRNARTRARTA